MADVGGPDIPLEMARLRLQIAQQETNIRAGEYRQQEITGELKTIATNGTAAQKAIDGMRKQLADLEAKNG